MMTPKDLPNWMGKTMRPQPYRKNHKQVRRAGWEREEHADRVFSTKAGVEREEHADWVFSTKRSALETQTQMTIQTQQVIFRNAYVHNNN